MEALSGLEEFCAELDDDLLLIANENLADVDICELAGVERVEDVRALALVVNTTDGNSVLGDLGRRVARLNSLKLSGSQLSTLRDLGTSWANLDVLWVARCGLTDLDGLHGLHCLRELYLAFNDIADLSGLAALEQLSVLDLEANKVSDLGQVAYLAQCAELTDLTLQHNPAARLEGYRQAVCSRLPQLGTLDEQEVRSTDRLAPAGPSSVDPAGATERAGGSVGAGADAAAADPLAEMRRELQLVMDGVKYAQVEGLTASISSAAGPMRRPATALSSRPTTAASMAAGRPLSGGSHGASLSRPRTSWRAPSSSALERGGSAPLGARHPAPPAPLDGAHSSPATPLRAERRAPSHLHEGHSPPASARPALTRWAARAQHGAKAAHGLARSGPRVSALCSRRASAPPEPRAPLSLGPPRAPRALSSSSSPPRARAGRAAPPAVLGLCGRALRSPGRAAPGAWATAGGRRCRTRCAPCSRRARPMTRAS